MRLSLRTTARLLRTEGKSQCSRNSVPKILLASALICAAALGLTWILVPTIAHGQVRGRISAAPKNKAGTKARAASSSGEGYVYFFDLAGAFEKVDVAKGIEVAHGQIAAGRALTDQTPNFDGCILCAIRPSPGTHRLYAVLANHAQLAADGSNTYRIVALNDADLAQVAVTSADAALPAAPNILIMPGDNQLLASYPVNSADEKQNEERFALAIFDLSDLKLTGTIHEATTTDAIAAGTPVNIVFTNQAYVGPGGTIFDHFDTITRSEDQFHKSTFNPFEVLAAVSEGPLLRYGQNGTGGREFYAVDYADSANGKILVTLNAGKSNPQAVLVIDGETHNLSLPIAFSQLTVHTVHLTPDAARVLVEEITWQKPESGAAQEMNWTGRFVVFDSQSGKQVSVMNSAELKGGRIVFLGMSSDGKAAYFANAGKLYVLNLGSGRAKKIVTSGDFKFDNWTSFAAVD